MLHPSAVLSSIAVQGIGLTVVYADFIFCLVGNIYGLSIGALANIWVVEFMFLIPFVMPCLLLSGCLKAAMCIISKYTDVKHVSQQSQAAPPRSVRRGEALRCRRCFKKFFRERAKQYRRLRADYGAWAAWVFYHPAARHLFALLVDTTLSLMIGLLWTCVAVVLVTLLRILVALVIYTIALVVAVVVLWFAVVLLGWLGIELATWCLGIELGTDAHRKNDACDICAVCNYQPGILQ